MTQTTRPPTWRAALRLESDARVSYVLLVDYKQVLDPRNPRKAVTSSMSQDMEFHTGGETMEMSWFSMPDWKEPAYLGADAPPQGRIEKHELASEVIESKVPIQVYVPEGYGVSEARYPVVYVHGGDEALEHGQWNQALDHFVGKQVAPLIAVFVGDFPARGPQNTQIFTGEIVPFVDETFRTIAKASGRAPWYLLKKSSSHNEASRSRWLVGSSKSKRSGSVNNSEARATRIRQPPEKLSQGCIWAASSKPRPAKIRAAREWAV